MLRFIVPVSGIFAIFVYSERATSDNDQVMKFNFLIEAGDTLLPRLLSDQIEIIA